MLFEAHELRRLAVLSEVSPETVTRFLAGLPVRGLSRARIERGLDKLRAEGPADAERAASADGAA